MKQSEDEAASVYDIMSDPGVSRPTSRGSQSRRSAGVAKMKYGNAASTRSYREAINQYKKTVDPSDSFYSTASSQRPSSSQRANLHRGGQGPVAGALPASNLFVNSGMRALQPPSQQNGVPYNMTGNSDTLSYSQSVDSNASPEKHSQFMAPINGHSNVSPPQRYTGKQQTKSQQMEQQQQQIEANSSSTFDDYLESSSYENDDGLAKSPISPSSSYSFPQYPGSPAQTLKHRRSDTTEPEMVDTTYEEHYGDAYTGKPLRYIYPQGYGSMRPRSRPWQISLIACSIFAWLNVFIVGHCSDRFNEQNNANDDGNANANDGNNYNNYYGNQQMDDDAQKIESKWCGSRPLYFMWVLSVALMGISCAYCSIIGYVKARDFAIANGRSQPPGMAGKSDYYVQIEEDVGQGTRRGGRKSRGSHRGYESYQQDDDGSAENKTTLKKVIYQADGTPRFFGGQIYKPTQAAVNLTSR